MAASAKPMMHSPRHVTVRLSGDRTKVRRDLLAHFIDELPGTGPGKGTSRYVYNVQQTLSGHVVELWRPANRNKGLDFTVRVTSVAFNALRNPWPHVPRHDDLIKVLRLFRRHCPADYPLIQSALRAVYHCRIPAGISKLKTVVVHPVRGSVQGCPADVAIAVARWLFVEQDLTYWNHSGRAMLIGKLRERRLV